MTHAKSERYRIREMELEREREHDIMRLFADDPSLKWFVLALGAAGAGAVMKLMDAGSKKESGENYADWAKRIGLAVVLPPSNIGLVAQLLWGNWDHEFSSGDAALTVSGLAAACCLLYAAKGSGATALLTAAAGGAS